MKVKIYREAIIPGKKGKSPVQRANAQEGALELQISAMSGHGL
jgi:hypothetical protein